jgi:hypothetical protein
MFGEDWRKGLLVELASYIDESGTHNGSRILTIGGYLGQIEQWLEFRREWSGFLLSHGIEHFHMTDFDSPDHDGPFKDWPLERKIPFQCHLIELIHKRLAYGIYVGVNLDDLSEVFQPRNRRELLIAAYSLGFMSFTVLAHFWSRDHGSILPIAYFVESGSKLGRIIPFIWQQFTTKEQLDLLLGTLTWVKKKEDKHHGANCEAADMLAYEGQKYFSGRKRKSFRVLVRQTDYGHCLRTADIEPMLYKFLPPEKRNAYLKQFEDFNEDSD